MKKYRITFLAEYFLICMLIGELVYSSLKAGVWFLPAFPLYVWFRGRKAKEEENYQRNLQLKDALNGLQAALEAGYSLENAFREAKKELEAIYPEGTYICREFDQILRRMANGVAVEEAFAEFAKKSRLEDAENLAETMATTKRMGGDLLQVIRSTVSVIATKLEVKREIRTITAQKRMEGNVMKLVPPGMLIYFRIFSPGFMEPLYQGMGGKLLMSLLLAAYLFMVWLMEYLTSIEI